MTESDLLWARVSAWLAERTVKECFTETFSLVDQLCDALEMADAGLPDYGPARGQNRKLIERARSITGKGQRLYERERKTKCQSEE